MKEFAFLFFIINIVLLALQVSYLKLKWLISSVFPAIVLLAWLFYPIAIEQSINEWYRFVANKGMVGNWALLFCFEAMAGFYLSFRLLYDDMPKKRLKLLSYIPGPSILVSMAGVEVMLFFSVHGIDFLQLALLVGGVLALAIVLLAVGFKKRADLSQIYEYRMWIHGIQLSIGVLMSMRYWSSPASLVSAIEWLPFMSLIGLVALGVLVGYGIKVKG